MTYCSAPFTGDGENGDLTVGVFGGVGRPAPNAGDVSFGLIPANRFAVVHCAGDLHKEERAWKHLFHAWLPRSGYEPTGDSTMEVYRRSPVELGWETFDN